MEGVDVLYPFKVWIWLVILCTLWSFIGTWIVIARSKLLK